MQTKSQIRRQIRTLRRQLSKTEQQHSGNAIAKHITEQFSQCKRPFPQRVALFLSMDGEIDTQPAINQLWQAQVEVYIPLIHPFNHQQLIFIRYTPDTPLRRNPLGMLEPQLDCSKVGPIAQLDVIFTPLVAFDPRGMRLGMGGGFYDRTLAYHYRQKRSVPAIIGLAHDCQQVGMVPVDPWDLPLKQIITPSAHFVW